MSSMVKRILAGGTLAVSVAAAAATLSPTQNPSYGSQTAAPPVATPVSPYQADSVAMGLAEWSRLRQSDNYSFSDYARFLLRWPGWPGEAAMRKTAERQINPDSYSPAEVVAFFTRYPPQTNAGKVRYAEALDLTGRRQDAQIAARAAWTSGVLSPTDESRLLTRFSGAFTPTEHDARMEALLGVRAGTAAVRQLPLTSLARRPVYEARIALQTRRVDADSLYAAVATSAAGDPGLFLDRALWLRDSNQGAVARNFASQPRSLTSVPYDAEKWLEGLLLLARGAYNDNQMSFAYGIARQADFAFAAGTDIRERPLGERDDYTSLVWLGGQAARRLSRHADAVSMFDRYARAAKTPQTQTKGYYWAGRSAQAGGNIAQANSYFTMAANHVDQFYGQLAAERLGKPIAIPPEPAMVSIPAATRASFENSDLVRAARMLGAQGRRSDQTQFLRTLAQTAKTDADHILAGELARSLGRPDLGVMVSRVARNSGTPDPVRIGFPQVPVPTAMEARWTMTHAIIRQESQFDREAVSHAGARGLMQLMPGTAREQSGKLGLPYDFGRLTQDINYNVMLGSAYFDRMLNYYGGNHVLAVAAYNAGPGNVNKFIRANGDPRMGGVDVVDWIEAIPLSETRGYVQRVLENAVVYDLLHPQRARMPARNRLSAYLGKNIPG